MHLVGKLWRLRWMRWWVIDVHCKHHRHNQVYTWPLFWVGTTTDFSISFPPHICMAHVQLCRQLEPPRVPRRKLQVSANCCERQDISFFGAAPCKQSCICSRTHFHFYIIHAVSTTSPVTASASTRNTPCQCEMLCFCNSAGSISPSLRLLQHHFYNVKSGVLPIKKHGRTNAHGWGSVTVVTNAVVCTSIRWLTNVPQQIVDIDVRVSVNVGLCC